MPAQLTKLCKMHACFSQDCELGLGESVIIFLSKDALTTVANAAK